MLTHTTTSNRSHGLLLLTLIALLIISVAPASILGDQGNDPPWQTPTVPDTTAGMYYANDAEMNSGLADTQDAENTSVSATDYNGDIIIDVFELLLWIM